MFSSDQVLVYDVEPWASLGFGVPNCGNNKYTLNGPIHGLVDEIGHQQIFIGTHLDARRTQPPSINTVMRIAKLCERVRRVLFGRMKKSNQQRLEAGHADPAPQVFLLHPCPYFNSDVIRNRWLREYNQLTMLALTHAVQHTSNQDPLTITDIFALEVWAFFREVKILLGTELLDVPREEVEKDDFVFTAEHFATYDPFASIANTEAREDTFDAFGPTEDDLKPLVKGLRADQIPTRPAVTTPAQVDAGLAPPPNSSSTGAGVAQPPV